VARPSGRLKRRHRRRSAPSTHLHASRWGHPSREYVHASQLAASTRSPASENVSDASGPLRTPRGLPMSCASMWSRARNDAWSANALAGCDRHRRLESDDSRSCEHARTPVIQYVVITGALLSPQRCLRSLHRVSGGMSFSLWPGIILTAARIARRAYWTLLLVAAWGGPLAAQKVVVRVVADGVPVPMAEVSLWGESERLASAQTSALGLVSFVLTKSSPRDAYVTARHAHSSVPSTQIRPR